MVYLNIKAFEMAIYNSHAYHTLQHRFFLNVEFLKAAPIESTILYLLGLLIIITMLGQIFKKRVYRNMVTIVVAVALAWRIFTHDVTEPVRAGVL